MGKHFLISYLLMGALIWTPGLILILYLIMKDAWLPLHYRTVFSHIEFKQARMLNAHYAKVKRTNIMARFLLRSQHDRH